jgi:DNA polymerase-3 subunit epsilon/exodeoxyribonuclease X
MAKYVLFDTETTGIEDKDRIIQLGAMIIDSKGKVEKFDELCNTDVPITIESMEIHGITPQMIENQVKCIDTNFYKMLLSLNTDENYLIAHNLPFDLSMIEKEGFTSNMKHIDTLRCAKHLFNDSPYHRLQYFRYSLELYKLEQEEATKHDITIKAHEAIGDVLVMKLFLSKLVQKARELYPEVNPMKKLHELTKTPVLIEVFKFGKYKDQKIADVCDKDMGYINWMMDKMDLDEDMKYTLDKIMGYI